MSIPSLPVSLCTGQFPHRLPRVAWFLFSLIVPGFFFSWRTVQGSLQRSNANSRWRGPHSTANVLSKVRYDAASQAVKTPFPHSKAGLISSAGYSPNSHGESIDLESRTSLQGKWGTHCHPHLMPFPIRFLKGFLTCGWVSPAQRWLLLRLDEPSPRSVAACLLPSQSYSGQAFLFELFDMCSWSALMCG